MNRRKGIAISPKNNFYLNLFNLVLFGIAALSGFLLQIEYHMHRLPETSVVLGLDQAGWLWLHKASATFFAAGIVVHCLLNRQFISACTRRLIGGNFSAFKSFSYWVFAICVFTCLSAILSWTLFGAQDPGRHILVESHDKLGLFLILVTVIHVFSRAGKMTRAYRRLFQAES